MPFLEDVQQPHSHLAGFFLGRLLLGIGRFASLGVTNCLQLSDVGFKLQSAALRTKVPLRPLDITQPVAGDEGRVVGHEQRMERPVKNRIHHPRHTFQESKISIQEYLAQILVNLVDLALTVHKNNQVCLAGIGFWQRTPVRSRPASLLVFSHGKFHGGNLFPEMLVHPIDESSFGPVEDSHTTEFDHLEQRRDCRVCDSLERPRLVVNHR